MVEVYMVGGRKERQTATEKKDYAMIVDMVVVTEGNAKGQCSNTFEYYGTMASLENIATVAL